MALAPTFSAVARLLVSSRTAAAVQASSSSAAFRAMSSGNKQQGGSEAEPYVYQSPGSSIHDPALTGHSLSNPVYIYDPQPTQQQAAQPIHAASKAVPTTRPPVSSTAVQKQQPRPTAAYAQQQVNKGQQQQQQQEVSYVYTPPGSSVSSPSYGFSVRDPVYVVDPAPTSATRQAASASKPHAQPQQQQVAAAPAPGQRRVGLPVDDLASAPYVTSPRGSMHEPRYVSVSDPQDAHAARK